jgi:hypothetical protein
MKLVTSIVISCIASSWLPETGRGPRAVMDGDMDGLEECTGREARKWVVTSVRRAKVWYPGPSCGPTRTTALLCSLQRHSMASCSSLL